MQVIRQWPVCRCLTTVEQGQKFSSITWASGFDSFFSR